jgi:uncharacterized membrane protein YfcA
LRRIWTLLLAASVGIWFSVSLLVWADVALLSGVLGVLLCIYSGFSLLTPQVPPPGRWEGWLSPAIGAVNGFFTGITGSSVVPGVLYLQALGMERDALVQAMGVLFTVSTGVLAAALAGSNLLSMEMGVLSGVALVPSFLGMVLGQRIRRLLPESRFRKVFFTALLILGAYIIMRNLF